MIYFIIEDITYQANILFQIHDISITRDSADVFKEVDFIFDFKVILI